jgi:hypothetical protein
MTSPRSRYAGPLLLVLVGAVVGCNQPHPADVSGIVRYQGKAVRSGSVIVFDPAGGLHPGNINKDGSYTVRGVPSGPVQFAVQSPEPERPKPPRKAPRKPGDKKEEPIDINLAPEPPSRGDWFALPARYSTPASSGLSTSLNPGANTFDIEMK